MAAITIHGDFGAPKNKVCHCFHFSPSTFPIYFASLVVQLVKNLPVMQETPVQFLGWEDPLEKEKAIHSSILALSIPWTV